MVKQGPLDTTRGLYLQYITYHIYTDIKSTSLGGKKSKIENDIENNIFCASKNLNKDKNIVLTN